MGSDQYDAMSNLVSERASINHNSNATFRDFWWGLNFYIEYTYIRFEKRSGRSKVESDESDSVPKREQSRSGEYQG